MYSLVKVALCVVNAHKRKKVSFDSGVQKNLGLAWFFSPHNPGVCCTFFLFQNSKPFQTQWKKAVFKYKAEKTHFPVLLSKFNSNLAFRDLESDKFSFFSKKCFPSLKRVCRHLVSRFQCSFIWNIKVNYWGETNLAQTDKFQESDVA